MARCGASGAGPLGDTGPLPLSALAPSELVAGWQQPFWCHTQAQQGPRKRRERGSISSPGTLGEEGISQKPPAELLRGLPRTYHLQAGFVDGDD